MRTTLSFHMIVWWLAADKLLKADTIAQNEIVFSFLLGVSVISGLMLWWSAWSKGQYSVNG